MAKLKMSFDIKKLEKELNKQVDKIVKEKQKELLNINNKENLYMNKLLSINAETLLRICLKKYEETQKYEISGNTDELPEHFKFGLNSIMHELEIYGYILRSMLTIGGGWNVVLTPEALEYFEKKGLRVELFEELVESEKNLLKELIKIEKEDGNLTDFLKNKLQDDSKDMLRGIIKTLDSNGLINTLWADDTIYDANLTQAGRTYFERERKYNEKMTRNVSNTYIGDINASNSNLVLGDVTNSTLNVDNSISRIEEIIDKNCKDDIEKQDLKEILEETKEIIENMKESRHIDKRKSFFDKLSSHLEKHGWFYGAIVNLLGETAIMLLSGTN